ncbi:hypothetical protein A8H33_21355 [Burkholderia vietnamiensis]|nr:hypothetical protein A8H33_21355 [Burkholderia vietnamiensis]
MLESHKTTCYRNSAKMAADVSLTETPGAWCGPSCRRARSAPERGVVARAVWTPCAAGVARAAWVVRAA